MADDDHSVSGTLRALVRRALRLRRDDTSELWRYGMFVARVDAAAGDGSTVDVTPEDSRLKPIQGVQVRVSPPGAVWQVSSGARCLIGWERGDAAKVYAVPTWEQGATVVKLVLNGTMVILGAEGGAQFVALSDLVKGELDKIAAAFSSFVPGTGGAHFTAAYTAASSVASSQVKAK